MKVVTQVQDGSYGKPAAGIRAHLARAVENDWVTVADAETNNSGRIPEWNVRHLERGVYQIAFDADAYFAGLGMTAAYPEIIVVFRARDDLNEFQVQVTLAPYSYTAYCGTADS
jgi:5-hydroxyisourate hydrolase